MRKKRDLEIDERERTLCYGEVPGAPAAEMVKGLNKEWRNLI